jgi:hypothetical protein
VNKVSTGGYGVLAGLFFEKDKKDKINGNLSFFRLIKVGTVRKKGDGALECWNVV